MFRKYKTSRASASSHLHLPMAHRAVPRHVTDSTASHRSWNTKAMSPPNVSLKRSSSSLSDSDPYPTTNHHRAGPAKTTTPSDSGKGKRPATFLPPPANQVFDTRSTPSPFGNSEKAAIKTSAPSNPRLHFPNVAYSPRLNASEASPPDPSYHIQHSVPDTNSRIVGDATAGGTSSELDDASLRSALFVRPHVVPVPGRNN